MAKFVLSIDQGTTSSRAIVFDKGGNILYIAQREFAQHYPKRGWVEHDPEEIYQSVKTVMVEVFTYFPASDFAAVGITNQRETAVVWNKKTGKCVYNAIVWQCRRTSDFMEELGKDKAELIYSKTGLMCDAYFSASKVKWILDNVAGARQSAQNGELAFGTIDTYLLYRLTGGKSFATDYTNASRTMLFNIHDKQWDDELCELFTVPKSMLATVRPSGYKYGETAKSEVGASLPICSLVGDQQGSLFGQHCWDKGDVKNTYGTGCFLLMNTMEEAVRSKHGLITSLGASLDENVPYVLEGSVFVAGAGIQWLRDELGLISSAKETEQIARSVGSSNGVYFVPAFVGLGAPHWDSDARGMLTGLTRGANKAHIVRAVLESIAYRTNEVLLAMEKDIGASVPMLKVDGGASSNDFLMQFQADVSDKKVLRPAVVETTALGAAYLAGLCVGLWRDKEEIAHGGLYREFSPDITEEERQRKTDGWYKAVNMAKHN